MGQRFCLEEFMGKCNGIGLLDKEYKVEMSGEDLLGIRNFRLRSAFAWNLTGFHNLLNIRDKISWISYLRQNSGCFRPLL